MRQGVFRKYLNEAGRVRPTGRSLEGRSPRFVESSLPHLALRL